MLVLWWCGFVVCLMLLAFGLVRCLFVACVVCFGFVGGFAVCERCGWWYLVCVYLMLVAVGYFV